MKICRTLLFASLLLASCSGGQTVIEDFESGSIDSWTVEGDSFLANPMKASDHADISGIDGNYFFGCFAGETPEAFPEGAMTSPEFTIRKDYINFLFGGTTERFMRSSVSADLIVDGETVFSAHPHGEPSTQMGWHSWNVKEYKGKTASIRIRVNAPAFLRSRAEGPLVLVDRISMSNRKLSSYNDVFVKELTAEKKYLLIPSSDAGQMSSLSIMADGVNILGTQQNFRLAGDAPDYCIPVDISAYGGKTLSVTITGVDDNDRTVTDLSQSDDKGIDLNEKYRPIVHFSPEFGWTNDPNGMVYYDGEYHLAYQANPYGTRHSNMHWGNAVSTDLVHWKDLSPIIAPDELGAIFSGSSVVDKDNTAGFGKDAIVAMYTSAGAQQRQSIAYSLDRGRTFTKYEGNPVLTEEGKRDFRDPKVMRYGDKWIVSVAAGDVISFYGSKDLKTWEHLSDFGKGIGSHAAVWECPDLMKMEYGGKEKWVLIVNINPGGPNGGSVGQYFIGQFDGKEFKADPLPNPLWIDEGVDNYAGVTFSNTGDRHIFMGWMSNWLYSNEVPTRFFRNSMTLPRDLSIRHNGKHLFLASAPSPEVYNARGESKDLGNISQEETTFTNFLPGNEGAYEIDFTVTPSSGGTLGFTLGNDAGEAMVYTFDFGKLTLNLDRSRSGRTDFHKDFGKKDILTHLVKNNSYQVKLFVDKHSTEMFINDGDVAFTNCMFPTEIYGNMTFSAKGVSISDVKVYKMQ